MSADAPAIHHDLLPLSWLIGVWVGVGTLQYPTIAGAQFGQEVSFSTDGRPFLTYFSRSWLLDEAGNRVRPLATESGFWRPQPDNQLEILLAHPTGYAETWIGSLEVTGMENAQITGARITMSTDAVVRTSTAKEYSRGERLYGLVDGCLLWTFDMAAVGHGMSNHLAAKLFPMDPAESGS